MSLIEALIAEPNPELALFGRFVGDWDMDIEFYNGRRDPYRGRGLWSFGWVLDGHAIQDVFSYPTDSGRGIGTTLRTYSRDSGEWQIIYLGAVRRSRHRVRRCDRSRHASPERSGRQRVGADPAHCIEQGHGWRQ